jgi:hypothetical protein
MPGTPRHRTVEARFDSTTPEAAQTSRGDSIRDHLVRQECRPDHGNPQPAERPRDVPSVGIAHRSPGQDGQRLPVRRQQLKHPCQLAHQSRTNPQAMVSCRSAPPRPSRLAAIHRLSTRRPTSPGAAGTWEPPEPCHRELRPKPLLPVPAQPCGRPPARSASRRRRPGQRAMVHGAGSLRQW